jgi:hypothetical protein
MNDSESGRLSLVLEDDEPMASPSTLAVRKMQDVVPPRPATKSSFPFKPDHDSAMVSAESGYLNGKLVPRTKKVRNPPPVIEVSQSGGGGPIPSPNIGGRLLDEACWTPRLLAAQAAKEQSRQIEEFDLMQDPMWREAKLMEQAIESAKLAPPVVDMGAASDSLVKPQPKKMPKPARRNKHSVDPISLPGMQPHNGPVDKPEAVSLAEPAVEARSITFIHSGGEAAEDQDFNNLGSCDEGIPPIMR